MDKVYAMLGLAEKAGKIASGGFLTEKAVKERKAKLVVIASDSSDRTAETIKNKCSYYKVPCYVYGVKDMLGRAIGKESRSCAAVLDSGFSGSIEKLLNIEANNTMKNEIDETRGGDI